jgi:Transport and Golgi organisation 2
VCTVVVRRSEGTPPRILALRDELTTRDFDDPARWWPEFPDVVGGRDRTAGGTWCATSVATGATALVVNRPQKQVADPGAPSRGVLPLLAVAHGADWPAYVDLPGMASFALMLVTPDRATTWDFDGQEVVVTEHPEGTTMLTSGGPENRKADVHLESFAEAGYPDGWRGLVQSGPPSDDPAALVVRHEQDDLVFATVFGELIEAAPGWLRLEYSRRPWEPRPWKTLSQGEVPASPRPAV